MTYATAPKPPVDDAPEGFVLGEWIPGRSDGIVPGTILKGHTWKRAWVKINDDNTAHVIEIRHDGDWWGLYNIVHVKRVRIAA